MMLPRFRSYCMAGFECTRAVAADRKRLDLLRDSGHDKLYKLDYELLREQNIFTVREGFSWSQIDKGSGIYDFSRYQPILEEGKRLGIQQIWDLNHFDYPTHIDPFSEAFIFAFASYAQRVLRILRLYYPQETLYIVPLNEISFFSWIGADRGVWAPYKKTSKNGLRFKKQLVRASIRAMDLIWEIDSNVRFIQVDPFMRRIAKEPASKTALKHARAFNEVIRFEAWDMLCGRTYPELGGHMRYLDIIGVNYYIHNQEWVISQAHRRLSHQLMDWDSEDRISLYQLLYSVFERYERPLLISETGSYGSLRPSWWGRTLSQLFEALTKQLPICGVCAYPVLDRVESAGFLLPHSGLWDFDISTGSFDRIPQEETLHIISDWSTKLEEQYYSLTSVTGTD